MKDEIIETPCINNIELVDFFAAFALHAILQRNEDRYSDQVTSEALMWANQMMDTLQREGRL